MQKSRGGHQIFFELAKIFLPFPIFLAWDSTLSHFVELSASLQRYIKPLILLPVLTKKYTKKQIKNSIFSLCSRRTVLQTFALGSKLALQSVKQCFDKGELTLTAVQKFMCVTFLDSRL